MSRVKRVIIEVPEGLRVPPDELEERLRIELALRLYEKGIASLGQDRRIAGLPKWDFLELLAKEGIQLHYSEDELKEDLEVAKKLAEGERSSEDRERLLVVSN
jgi:predicted HTH domain antitoxin